ncbi:MAG: zinc finger domain-containing protein [Euryarchaeota archaeon]|nr:zinc finger domain-containing protein [Euryarchaeota archaeon]
MEAASIEKICTSCGGNLDLGSIEFPCPNCGDVIIVRCSRCRQVSNRYKCVKCQFSGP